MIKFARAYGVPLSEALVMDPRDMDTWVFQEMIEQQERGSEARLLAAREEHAKSMGRR